MNRNRRLTGPGGWVWKRRRVRWCWKWPRLISGRAVIPLIGSELLSIIMVDLADGEANRISSPTGC